MGQRLITLNHPSSHLISNTIDEISVKWERLMDSVNERMFLMMLSVSFHEMEEKVRCVYVCIMTQCLTLTNCYSTRV